jgi:hypothetical protein
MVPLDPSPPRAGGDDCAERARKETTNMNATNELRVYDVSGDGDHCIVSAHDADEARRVSMRDNWGEDFDGEISVAEAPMDRTLRDEDGIDKPLSWWCARLTEPCLIASTLL